MRAGVKDRRINVEQVSRTRSDTGQPVETWSVFRTCWAQRVEGSRVSERFAGNQQYATVTTIFRVGYFPNYTAITTDDHRVMFEGRLYDIQGVVELGRKDGIELLCSARGKN